MYMFWIAPLLISLSALGHTEEPLEPFVLQISLQHGGQTSKVVRLAATSEGCISWANKQSRMESDGFCRKTLKDFRTLLNAAPKVEITSSENDIYIAQLQTTAGTVIRKAISGKSTSLEKSIRSLVLDLK